MKVQFRRPLTDDFGSIHSAAELNVVEGQVYEVCGIITTPNGCWYFLVDVDGVPMQRLAKHFRIVSHAVPRGWHFNFFPDESATVLGPSFLAKSIENAEWRCAGKQLETASLTER